MPNFQRRIVYLSDAQREQLFSNGSITVNGVTVTYSDSDMYVTPQADPLYPTDLGSGLTITNNKVVVTGKLDSSLKGAPNGLAELDENGKVKLVQLPTTIKCRTTSEWNSELSFVPDRGEVIIYSDRGTIGSGNQSVNVPGIKIGDGLAYLIDLPFVGEDREAYIFSQLLPHIQNTDIHITSAERTRWDAKLNCNITGEILEFNRS